MAPEEDLKKRVARKLTKRRKEGHQVTMEIPERFRDGDDAEEDCTAPHGANAYMNQSVFGMIAAAGSQVDFNARFNDQSSDEEDGSGEPPIQSSESQVIQKPKEKAPMKTKDHRRKFSDSRIIRAIPRLGSKSKSDSNSSSKSSSKGGSPVPESTSEAPPMIQVPRMPSKEASVMSRMLEAKAELSMRPSFDLPRLAEDGTPDDVGDGTSSSLARRLMEIFSFEQPERVVSGILYPNFGRKH
jgi:sterol 3beta-glucosyltransferase